MDKIIIVSKNAGIVSKDELKDLASNLKEKLDVNIEFSTPKLLGTQGTYHDVIEIWLILDRLSKTKVGDKIIDVIIDNFVEWAKKRMKTEKNKRPKSLIIYKKDKKVIKSITFNEKQEVEDNSNNQDQPPYPPKESESFDE